MVPDGSHNRTGSHRLDIQGMRALAVGSVILGHAGFSVFQGGFVGVDVFFVLSGYLITDLLIRERERTGGVSLRDFWARRARRLLPASALVLIATAFASIWILPQTQWKAISTDIIWSSLFAANWRFAQQDTDYFDQERAVSPVQHYWSLGVEEQFYVGWPLLVVGVSLLVGLVARRRSAGRPASPAVVRAGVALVAGLISVAAFASCVALTASNQPYAYFGTPSRAWQLGLGALLAAAGPWVGARLTDVARNFLAVVGLAGIAWCVLVLSEDGGLAYPGLTALVPTLASLSLIAGGLGGTALLGKVLSLGPLVKMGDWSYSLYLWHFPVLVLGVELLGSSASLRLGLIALTFVAAYLTYTVVENPIRSHPALVKRAGASLALGALLVTASVAAALVATPAVSSSTTTVTLLNGSRVELGPLLLDPSQGADAIPSCALPEFDDSTPEGCDTYGAGRSAARQVVILGDSHAANLTPPLSRVAEARGYGLTIRTKPACHVANVLTWDAARKVANTPCTTWNDTAFAQTLAEKPDLVVLLTANSPRKEVIVNGEVLSPRESRRYLVQGYRRTIQTFTSAGIPVAVIQDWPEANPKRTSAECLLETRQVSECLIPRTYTWHPETAAVRGIPLATLHRLDQRWCNATRCLPVQNDLLVYRDRSHLTTPFAMTLVPWLQTTLLP